MGASFDGDEGAVYIFMGSIDGIREFYSQKLKPSISTPTATRQPNVEFFGFGLSRGVDMDDNGFNDLAIGAPNSMKVYVFKSYPSIKIISTAYGKPREIPINNIYSEIIICAHYESYKNFSKPISGIFAVELYTPKRQATFINNFTDYNFEMELTPEFQCESFKLEVTADTEGLAYPISVEIHHSLKNVPNPVSKEFCTDCAMLNPYTDHFIKTKIPFVTGCKNKARCIANLKISSVPIDFNNDA